MRYNQPEFYVLGKFWLNKTTKDMKIIGRKKEIREFNELYNSGKAELVAVYGRRRVGKTFLIDESLAGKLTFRHTGLSPIESEQKKKSEATNRPQTNQMKLQLKQFYVSLQQHGMKKTHQPTSWIEAFFMLSQLLEQKDKGQRIVVFLDELPWMDTPRSKFVTAFEGFWNNWACHRHNVMVVVCGSATSWIQDNFIDNHGGLYGRVTREIKLSPFTLKECELFYNSRGVRMSRYDIVQSYMVMGGIPYYMNYVSRGMTLGQMVDEMFFGTKPRLQDEYDRLFASVFSKPADMQRIVEALYKRHAGWTRQQLINLTGLASNETFTKMLKALIASDFVVKYVPFGMKKSEVHYKLVDPFCWFWLHFVKGQARLVTDFWKSDAKQAVVSWRGIAFEEVCWYHWAQIKKALGIEGVQTELSAWTKPGDDEEDGTQIDLLLIRKDRVVNMCEMKFYKDEFCVSKAYHKTLVHRQNMLERELPKHTVVHSTLVTTEGLGYNEYSGDFQQVVTLEDIFE